MPVVSQLKTGSHCTAEDLEADSIIQSILWFYFVRPSAVIFGHRDPSLSERYSDPLRDGWSLTDFQGGGFRDIGPEVGAQLCHVVGEKRRLVTGA